MERRAVSIGVCICESLGVTKVAAIAGEVKNPNRNLPLSMIFSLFLITIVYTIFLMSLLEMFH